MIASLLTYAKRLATRPSVLVVGVLLLVSLGVFLPLLQSPAGTDMVNVADFLMDTFVTIRVPAVQRSAADAAMAEMKRLNRIFDRFDAGSEVSRVNAGAGNWVAVGPEMMELLSIVNEMAAEWTGDLFDVTVGPLMDVWGFGQDQQTVRPAPDDIQRALSLVDRSRLKLDWTGSRVMLSEPGMGLNLGGVAIGYAIDQAVGVLREHGVTSGLIEVGGDVYVIGQRPGGGAWRIGVQHPRQPGIKLGVLHLEEQAVATSGDYQRYFIVDGQRYHHILNPQTGYPSQGVISVTVVGPTATEVDILSTAVFLLSAEEGIALLESMPGVEGIIVNAEEEVFVTSGLKKGEGTPRFEIRQ
ncbi:MAG: FAD:protein FMN transferase [Dehalococcoidia bacterium]|nr:FAD:protein FMN transferase [Chloroflexota bacterium]MBT9161704.1 FAD:protein FMN transferase [Chloroflexota bacterium]